MNSRELNALMKGDPFVRPHWRGVFAYENAPRDGLGAYIINTSPSHVPVGHWVSVYDGQFFCSFGSSPELYGLPVMPYNPVMLQSIDSNTCGLFCAAYINARSRGYTLEDFLSCFTNDTNVNDCIVSYVYE